MVYLFIFHWCTYFLNFHIFLSHTAALIGLIEAKLFNQSGLWLLFKSFSLFFIFSGCMKNSPLYRLTITLITHVLSLKLIFHFPYLTVVCFQASLLLLSHVSFSCHIHGYATSRIGAFDLKHEDKEIFAFRVSKTL